MHTDLPAASVEPRPVVFFDGACPLCRREIAHYRRLDRAARLRWVDAGVEVSTLAGYGLTPESALAELHVLDGSGRWQRGIDAFLVIWAHLPGYRWLVRVTAVLRLRAPLGFAYRHFAAWRYRHRCGAGACATHRHPANPTLTREEVP